MTGFANGNLLWRVQIDTLRFDCYFFLQTLLQKSYKEYLAHVIDNRVSGVRLKDVPVVSHILNVFLNELPSLPLEWEIVFPINLVPGIVWISLPPYKMTSIELKMLKTQFQE